MIIAPSDHQALDDIVKGVVASLQHFTKPGRLPPDERPPKSSVEQEAFDQYGIKVLYSRRKVGVLRFEFVSDNSKLVKVDFDIAKLSRQYVENMVADVAARLRPH